MAVSIQLGPDFFRDFGGYPSLGELKIRSVTDRERITLVRPASLFNSCADHESDPGLVDYQLDLIRLEPTRQRLLFT